MDRYIDHSKQAIKDHSVFNGLLCPDKGRYERLFMHPNFKLVTFANGEAIAHVVFEEYKGGFIFHLVNFTEIKTRAMTELFIKDHVEPYCKKHSLSFIQATAERIGMARKLKKLGFENVKDNIYKKGLAHVL
tara:strand:- start:84 stop:479 length:396 start_codon:yes stop_codon:yes gene_type:complete